MPSQTKTTTNAQPPQLMPEGAGGYRAGQGFYAGQLEFPDVYQGQRSMGATDLQGGAINQARNTMGAAGGPDYSQLAKAELGTTLGGGWMDSDQSRAATQGLAQPIFERFENQTMPGIRDAAQFSGGGQGSRRTVANRNAIQELGYNLGQGAVAPIYEGERNRMTRQAIEGGTAQTNADIARSGALFQMGEEQRKLGQMGLSDDQARYEDAVARQAAAADALIGMATTGPGGSSAYYNPSVARMILGAGKA